MKQSALIFISIVLGIIFPFGHELTFLIRYTLMIMLLFAFVRIRLDRGMVTKSHLVIALLNLVIPFFLYFSFRPLGQDQAMIAFIMGITPTAAGAPILAQFLRTDIGYVTTAVIITSPLMALMIPFLLPVVVSVDQPIQIQEVLLPVVTIVGIPLVIAEGIKRRSKKLCNLLIRWRILAFYLFIFNVWIGSGKATQYLMYEQQESWQKLVQLAFVTALTCFILFKLGEFLERKSKPFAGGLATGRKNTMFALWLCLTFLKPLLVLGPIFYILCQNLYNTYQIWLSDRQVGKVE